MPQGIVGAGGHSWMLSSYQALGDLQPNVLWGTGDQDWMLNPHQALGGLCSSGL